VCQDQSQGYAFKSLPAAEAILNDRQLPTQQVLWDGKNRLRSQDEHVRGLKGHESIAQALAWVSIFNGPALKGAAEIVLRKYATPYLAAIGEFVGRYLFREIKSCPSRSLGLPQCHLSKGLTPKRLTQEPT
jgi:hypothetical protein